LAIVVKSFLSRRRPSPGERIGQCPEERLKIVRLGKAAPDVGLAAGGIKKT
jgi:hypothetical protein